MATHELNLALSVGLRSVPAPVPASYLLVANWLRSEWGNPIIFPALPEPEHPPQPGGKEAGSCPSGEGEEKRRSGGEEGRGAGGAEDRQRLQGEPGGSTGG